MDEPEHICNLRDPWPTGHPLPPEDPEKLEGPEVGEWVTYHHVRRTGVRIEGETRWVESVTDQPAKVLHRSYVWSPGECRHRGGYRHYDWSVIETFDGDRWYSVVVNDTDLRSIKTEAT